MAPSIPGERPIPSGEGAPLEQATRETAGRPARRGEWRPVCSSMCDTGPADGARTWLSAGLGRYAVQLFLAEGFGGLREVVKATR